MSSTQARFKSTAEVVAALRAAGSHDPDPLLRNPDTLAHAFLGPRFSLMVRIPLLRRLLVRVVAHTLPGAYCFHTARTRHIDGIVREAATGGIQQLVILGAGLDTRAHRFRDLLAGIPVFEADYPATQARKRARAERLPGTGPVRYVPIDFNHQRLEERLPAEGYDSALRTLFIWEGVSMYITPEAVDQVLAFIRANAPDGSLLVMEYVFRSVVEGTCTLYGAPEATRYVAKRGEPYVFGIPEGAVEGFLAERGLRLRSDLSGEALERAYLADETGRTHGRVHAYASLALAELTGA
jgi:methyltransferase (TIGR00027 family)